MAKKKIICKCSEHLEKLNSATPKEQAKITKNYFKCKVPPAIHRVMFA